MSPKWKNDDPMMGTLSSPFQVLNERKRKLTNHLPMKKVAELRTRVQTEDREPAKIRT